MHDSPLQGGAPRIRSFAARVVAFLAGSRHGPANSFDRGIACIIAKISVIMFGVEGGIMFLLQTVEPLLLAAGITSSTVLALIDGVLLVALAVPMIYLWVVLPYVRARERAEVMLRNAIENISEGFSMYDADDRLVLSNSRLKEFYPGIADVLVPGRRFAEILRIGLARGEFPEASGREEEWFERHMARHKAVDVAVERLTAAGRWVKILESRTDDGCIVGIRTDITDLKKRERELQESEERYRKLIEMSPDGLMVEQKGLIVYCNLALANLLGAKRTDQIVGRDALEFVPEEDHFTVLERRRRLVKGETLELWETVSRRLDGSIVQVERNKSRVIWQGAPANLVLVRDITDRKARERQFQQVVNSLQEGFVLYDADDRLVIWNDKWRDLHVDIDDLIAVGISFEELVKAKVGRNLLPEVNADKERAIADRIAAHRNPGEPFLRQTNDGRWYVIREVRTEDGGVFALNIDITDLKNAERAAQDARREAENAANVKSTFLANMSHELRTPLNAVIGFADAMKNRHQLNLDDSNLSDYIDAIYGSGRHLLSLINDLLDFSKIEAGRMELNDTDVNLGNLLDELSEQFTAQARNEGLQFVRREGTGLPAVRADALRLRQILLNLYSNAVKFTPKGGSVVLDIVHIANGGLGIRLADTGIGMDGETLRMLGETFRQFGGAHIREQAGTGLGVSIAMALARLHGGRLEYESVPDKGTTVTLVLPPERVLPVEGADAALG